MERFYPFILTMSGVALLGALVRPLWSRLSKTVPEQTVLRQAAVFNELLYWLFAAVILSTPAASFVLATSLQVHPRGSGILAFMACGVFLSLFAPLLIARLAGRASLEGFLQYLESRSRISRKTLTLFWLGTTGFVLSASLATSVSSW